MDNKTIAINQHSTNKHFIKFSKNQMLAFNKLPNLEAEVTNNESM